MLTVVPHTTRSLGTRFEVDVPTKFLKDGVFDGQQISSWPAAKVIKKLGRLAPDQITPIEDAVRSWLGI